MSNCSLDVGRVVELCWFDRAGLVKCLLTTGTGVSWDEGNLD